VCVFITAVPNTKLCIRPKKKGKLRVENPTKSHMLPRGRNAVAGLAVVAVVACAAGLNARSGSGTALLDFPMNSEIVYPMNADAIGISGLTTAKAQMAFGGMEALQRQVDEMGIHLGKGPKHVKQNFADAYGKLSALKKLVSHMETKDFDSANSRLSLTPDQALEAVLGHGDDEDVQKAQEAALHQRGRAGLHRMHSLHMARGRDTRDGRGVVTPPFMEDEARRVRFDPALSLSAAKRRRLAQRAAVLRVPDGEPVSPPWTR
jgi:hypothetical protein